MSTACGITKSATIQDSASFGATAETATHFCPGDTRPSKVVITHIARASVIQLYNFLTG